MFWQKKIISEERTAPWQILQWWRSAQDYLPWEIVDHERPFLKYSETVFNALIEFDDEWSLVKEKAQLQQVVRVLLKKAEELAEKEYSQLKKASSGIILKSSEYSPSKFTILPYIHLPRSANLHFFPDKQISLPLSMKMFFVDYNEGVELLDQKKLQWFSKLENNEIDLFVKKIAVPTFKKTLSKSDRKKYFVHFGDVLTQMDGLIFDTESLSQDYLKEIWKIPQFIFGDNQEQAALTRLLLQKSYQEQKKELYSTFLTVYEASLLQWQLLSLLSEAELEPVVGSIDQSKKQDLCQSLSRLYEQILNRCGVSFELIELYGPDMFLQRVSEVFYSFPAQDAPMSNLSGHHLYTLLLEDSVRFCMKHSQELSISPDDLLKNLVRIAIQRIAEFQNLRKNAHQDLQEAL